MILFEYLKHLKETFRMYFPLSMSEEMWMSVRFYLQKISDIKTFKISDQANAKLSSNISIYFFSFYKNSIPNFWLCVRNMYAKIVLKSTKKLFSFSLLKVILSCPDICVKKFLQPGAHEKQMQKSVCFRTRHQTHQNRFKTWTWSNPILHV